MATVPKQRRTREIEYPTGDGKPVAETGLHVRELLGTFETLDDHFAGHPNVFVGANMFEEVRPLSRRLASVRVLSIPASVGRGDSILTRCSDYSADTL